MTGEVFRKATAGPLLLGSYDRSVPRSCVWQARQSSDWQMPHAYPVPAECPQIRSGQAGRNVRFSPRLWAAAWKQIRLRKSCRSRRILRMWVPPASRKRRPGSRRSRMPPRRAHGTLQPKDESVIVGYYTSRRKCLPNAAPSYINQLSGGKCLWQEAMVSIVPAQEI